MEALKRGGRIKQKQKQKQSVVIKNVINIGKAERKRKSKRRRGTQKAPQAMQPFIPAGQQFPLQRLFQPQQQVYRSVVMGSSNAGEANNNVSPVIERTQQIQEGRVKAELENKLEAKPYRRLLNELNGVSDTQMKRFQDLTNDDDRNQEHKSPELSPRMPTLELSPFPYSPLPSYSTPSISSTSSTGVRVSVIDALSPPEDSIYNPATGRFVKNTVRNRKKIDEYNKSKS